MSEKNSLEFADFLAFFSIYLGIRNLTENERQSEQQIAILRQNDISSANDKQAQFMLKELQKQFDLQNQKIDKILSILQGDKQ